MRIPDKGEMEKLTRLSQVRERAALVELAAASALRNAAAERIAELHRDTEKAAKTPEAAVFQKWLQWRNQELRRRLSHLARMSANHAETSSRCGRVIAENAVVESLAELAKTEAQDQAEKRSLYDLAISSHLLSNNIGDQDV